MLRKILIANRGEIAVRIIRTCRKLGIKTVAVYADPDLESQHVINADEAYNIGPGQPSESYLNISKIVKVAKASKAEAVHPGYGFLAENPQFARECEEAGLVFIGPRSKILASTANKFASRETADRMGVPTIPGSKRQLETVEEAETEARRVGFPVLIKASFGGGGRGMRIVNAASELRKSFDLAASEAKGAFGRKIEGDRKSTRLNSSHVRISYAVFCLKKKKKTQTPRHISSDIITMDMGFLCSQG